ARRGRVDREGLRRRRAAEAPGDPMTRVLIGYDGAAAAGASIELVAALFPGADAVVATVHPPPPARSPGSRFPRWWRMLLREAQAREADVLVCGTRGEGPVDRVLFGSTASSLDGAA